MRARITFGGALGVLIILACVGGAVLAPWLAPHDPNLPMGSRWDPPNAEHWLGLDQIGRDMFSRILYGGRLSIGLALLAAVLAFIIGVPAGLTAGMVAGSLGAVLARVADIVLLVPSLVWALLAIAGFGATAGVIVLAIGLLYAMHLFRTARTMAMDLAAREYVEAARLRGETMSSVMLREILPNALPPLAAEFGSRFCLAFMCIAALGFLGLAVPLSAPDWGGMVKESVLAVPAGAAAPLYPAAAIALMVLGVNLLVDWLHAVGARAPREGG